MKYIELSKLLVEASELTKKNAGYEGLSGDGGAQDILDRLEKFKYSILIEKDLRPSEWDNNIEVGLPDIFKSDVLWINKIKDLNNKS